MKPTRYDSPTVQNIPKEEQIMYATFLSPEEGHCALGRGATFSWTRALTRPQRSNRTGGLGRHGDHLGSGVVTS